MFSDDGRFEPKALAVLAKSFVELKTLPTEPDMSKLYTEAFLPASNGSGVALMFRCSNGYGAAGAVAVALIVAGGAASAQTDARALGKAQANQFAFVPADVGVDTGIFKKHGIDLEISSFTRRRQGDAGADRGLARHRARRRAGLCHHRQGRADESGRGRSQCAEHHHAGRAQGRPDQERWTTSRARTSASRPRAR